MQIKTPPGKYRLMMCFDNTWCDIGIYDTRETAMEKALTYLSHNPSHVSIYYINHLNEDLELTRYKIVGTELLSPMEHIVLPKIKPFSLRNMFSKWFAK